MDGHSMRTTGMAATLAPASTAGQYPKGVFRRAERRPDLSLEGRQQAARRDEARFVTAGVRLAQLGLVERADPPQQLELVAEMRAHHLGPVGRDREAHAVVDE